MDIKKIKINDAKQIVKSYSSALKQYKETGKVVYPLDIRKHSIEIIIKSFKLNHAWQNKKLYDDLSEQNLYNRQGQIIFNTWDDVRDILLFLLNNSIVEEEIDVDYLKKDYDKFLEIADCKLKLSDELYWDKVYALIGIKKPLFFTY